MRMTVKRKYAPNTSISLTRLQALNTGFKTKCKHQNNPQPLVISIEAQIRWKSIKSNAAHSRKSTVGTISQQFVSQNQQNLWAPVAQYVCVCVCVHAQCCSSIINKNPVILPSLTQLSCYVRQQCLHGLPSSQDKATPPTLLHADCCWCSMGTNMGSTAAMTSWLPPWSQTLIL